MRVWILFTVFVVLLILNTKVVNASGYCRDFNATGNPRMYLIVNTSGWASGGNGTNTSWIFITPWWLQGGDRSFC
jgi:hypothetical protein